MNSRMLRDLLGRIQRLERGQVRHRLATVTDTSPLSVALGGSDTPFTDVKTIAGQTYTEGDVVSVLTFGGDLIVLGVVA